MNTYQHQELANGRWKELSLVEQLANVGSEVERTLKWKEKGKEEMSLKAFARALELLDLTLSVANSFSQRKEISRVRELLVDFIAGSNSFKSTPQQWRKYFYAFNYAARK